MLLAVLSDRTQAFACYFGTVLRLEDETLEVLGLLWAACQYSVTAVLAVGPARVILVPRQMISDDFVSHFRRGVLLEFGSHGHYALARIYKFIGNRPALHFGLQLLPSEVDGHIDDWLLLNRYLH